MAAAAGSLSSWRPDVSLAVLLRWLLRAGAVLLLLVLLWLQVLEYRAQPISTVIVQRQAPFPRLTLCPGASQRDYRLLRDRHLQLLNGSISVAEFYNLTTLVIPHGRGEMKVQDATPDNNFFPGSGAYGTWRQRFYMTNDFPSGHRPIRCTTFEPSAYLHELAANQLDVRITLTVSSTFTHAINIAYYLYVHGPEVPNVGDLNARQLGVSAPRTPFLNLRPGGEDNYRVAAQLRRLVNVRRRPCRSEPGYSKAQCLKECLWRRLAAHMGCRLPHMVLAGAFLPETQGPLDHLPPCRLLAQIDGPRDATYCHRFQDHREYLSQQCPNWLQFTYSWSDVDPSADEDTSNTNSSDPQATSGRCPPDVGELPMAEADQLVPQELLEDQRGCECPPACHQVVYIIHDTRSPTGEDFICRTNVHLQVHLLTDQIEEALSFTPSTLVANLGGFLGLVTGYSLFTLMEFMETLVGMMSSRRQAHPTVNVLGVGEGR